jgi:hypothetical protein
MGPYRSVSVELDAFDLAVLASHARERVNETSKIVKAEEKAGRPDSITACMARESLGNWKVTLTRLNKGYAVLRRQQRAATRQREAEWEAWNKVRA